MESTYIMYVPQLVTVRYPLSSLPKTHQSFSSSSSQHIEQDKKNKDEEKKKKVVFLKSKKKKENEESAKKQRKGKINLISSRINHKDISMDALDKVNSSFSRYSEPLSLPIQTNHIKTEGVLDTMACNLFECNGIEGID